MFLRLQTIARSLLMLKKGDVILIVSILFLITATFLLSNAFRTKDNSTDKIAEIIQNEKVFRSVDLNKIAKTEKITIKGKYQNVIEVEQGKIRFLEANCPDNVCVKTGWLQNNGDIAVCLPNHTIIKLVGKAENVDVVSY